MSSPAACVTSVANEIDQEPAEDPRGGVNTVDKDACSPVKALRVLAIVGMHRSGTSCLTGLVEEAGLHLGKVSKWNPHNRRGNQEHAAIVALNDEVLAANGASWDAPPEGLCHWTAEQEARRDALVASHIGRQPWAFKDPRTLLTMEGWLAGIPDLAMLGTFRHPLAVARSLVARQGGDLEAWLDLWCHYNRRLLGLYRRQPFPLVCFDRSQELYLGQVRHALRHCGLPMPTTGVFFDASLRRQAASDARDPLPEACRDLYQALENALDASQEGGAESA